MQNDSGGPVPMNRRPMSVTIIAFLFITAGLAGILYHSAELKGAVTPDLILIFLIRFLAIAGGIFALRGSRWARWLLIAWIAYHTVLSIFHPLSELLIHSVLLVVVAYVLFRPPASLFFKRQPQTSASSR